MSQKILKLTNDGERDRLEGLLRYEKQAKALGFRVICGIDEAGRGPLAGPVVACACIVDHDHLFPGVNDSKKLTPKKREYLYQNLTNSDKVHYGLGIVSNDEIDRINILQATIKAMQIAIAKLTVQPDILFVDGMELRDTKVPCKKIIKGDAKSYTIASASIIAKVTRDHLMDEYHEKYPHYLFHKNRGYGTKDHMAAIKKHGSTPIHRRSFEPIKSMATRGQA